MLFLVITCLLYLQILKEDNGECSCKGRKTSFPLSFPFFLYGLSFSLKGQKNWLFTFGRCFSLCCISYLSRGLLLLPWGFTLSSMGTTMKGIYKGFKCISNIFVVKEREMEMEIGFPTDVKHVAHIGWDGPSGNAPSWMNEFKTGPDFAATSIGNSGSALSPWASQDFGESMRQHSTSEHYKDAAPKELRTNPKKQKRRKAKSTSSPKSNSSSSSRSSRAAKPKTKFVEDNAKPADIEVA